MLQGANDSIIIRIAEDYVSFYLKIRCSDDNIIIQQDGCPAYYEKKYQRLLGSELFKPIHRQAELFLNWPEPKHFFVGSTCKRYFIKRHRRFETTNYVRP